MAYENTDDLFLLSTVSGERIDALVKVTDTMAMYLTDDGRAVFIEIDTAASTLSKTEYRTSGPQCVDFTYLTPKKPSDGVSRFLYVEDDSDGPGGSTQHYLRVAEIDPINKTMADGPRSDSLYSDGSLPDDKPSLNTSRPATTVCTAANQGYCIISVLDTAPDPSLQKFYLVPWTVSGLAVTLSSPVFVTSFESTATQYCMPTNAAPDGGGGTIQFWSDRDEDANTEQLKRDEGGQSSAGSCNTAVGDVFNNSESSSSFGPFRERDSVLDGDNPIVLAVSDRKSLQKAHAIVAKLGASYNLAYDGDDNIPYAGDSATWISTWPMGPAKFAIAHEAGGDAWFSECRINKNLGITFGIAGSLEFGGADHSRTEFVIPMNDYQAALVVTVDFGASDEYRAWLIVGLTGFDSNPPAGDTDLYAGDGALAFRSTLPFDKVSPNGIDLKEPDSTLVVGSLDGADEFVVYAETPYTSTTANPDGVDTPTSHPVNSLKWL